MDRRLPAGLKARAPRLAAHPTALETCSLRVCSALRKRMASLSCCVSPTPGAWEPSGGGRGHCIKKCFIRRSKFCTTGLHLLFCIVYVCGSPPPRKLYFSSHTAPPPRPCFSLLCRGGERKMCVGFLEEIKQHKTKNNLCILDETKPNGR